MKKVLPIVITSLALASSQARAGVDELLAAIQRSDFRFGRNQSDVPFAPGAWVQTTFHPRTELENGAEFSERSLLHGAIVPVYVSQKDMFLVGESFEQSTLETTTGTSATQSVLSVGPLAAWLRQYKEDDMLAVFVAPFFSRELKHHDTWATESFSGIVNLHWQHDRLTWLYGAVHQYSYGANYFYPYAGVLWTPSQKWVVSVVFPWPAIYYAPRQDFMLMLGISPGGSSYQSETNGVRTTNSLDAWNLTASAGWCFHKRLWLVGGVGLSGLSRLSATTETDERIVEVKSSPLFTLSVQFRP